MTKPDNIQITTHERLGNEVGGKTTNVNGDYLPYSQVGTVVDETVVLCANCATEKELKEGPLIQSNDEWDYPGAICEDCNKPLDTYLLVYKGQDPKLWHKIVWNQQLGNLDSIYTKNEKLAKQAENEAYELGYAEAGTFADSVTEKEIENDPLMGEYSTDSAHYANVIAPELRAISGFIDSTGKGTYTDNFNDFPHEVFNQGVVPAFHSGYYDAIVKNRDKWDSKAKWEL